MADCYPGGIGHSRPRPCKLQPCTACARYRWRLDKPLCAVRSIGTVALQRWTAQTALFCGVNEFSTRRRIRLDQGFSPFAIATEATDCDAAVGENHVTESTTNLVGRYLSFAVRALSPVNLGDRLDERWFVFGKTIGDDTVGQPLLGGFQRNAETLFDIGRCGKIG